MAVFVDTNEGVISDGECQDEELEQWLIDNNIECAKQKLLQKKVKLDELAEIEPINAKEYAKTSLGLDEIEAIRFVKAIKSLSSVNSDNNPLSQSQIIVLSKEANDSLNNLYDKKEEIDGNIKNILSQIDILKEVSKSNEENINKFKQEIIDKLNERLQHLLRKSNKEITSKINILSNHLETLEKYNKDLIETESKTNILLNDTTINKTKREQQINELSQNILDTEIIEDELEIMPRVKININKNMIMEDINKIGIISYSLPTSSIPASSVKVNNITNTICEDYGAVDDENKNNDLDIFEPMDSNDNDKDIVTMDWKSVYVDNFGIDFKEMDDMKEYWKILGEETSFSNDSMTITKLSDDYSSSFGNICIRSIGHRICLWQIKINKVNKYFAIGISSDFSSENKTFYDNVKWSNYGYCDNGNKVSKDVLDKYGKSWSDGDIIGIKLDEIQKCVEFIHNGESQGIAYRNIDTHNDISYKLAVHMYYTDTSVTIMQFEYL